MKHLLARPEVLRDRCRFQRVISALGRLARRPWWWPGAALAELGVLLGADISGVQSPRLTSGFAIAAFTAAIGAGPGVTAMVGAAASTAAVGTGFLVSLTPAEWTARIGLATAGSALAVMAAAKRRAGEVSLGRTTRLAEAAQGVMLRPPPTRLGPYVLSARYVAATAEVNLGGDFFDVVFHPSGAVVAVIGDVVGHGFDAVETAAHVLAAFRQAAFATTGLEQLVERLGLDIAPLLDDDEFVTVLAIWLLPDGTASAVSLGHPPPWVLGPNGVRTLEGLRASPPIGLPQRIVPSPLALGVGDQLVAYTDGLVEARNRHGEFFPAEQALCDTARMQPGDQLDTVLARVTAFSGGSLADDVTLLMLRYQPPVKCGMTTRDRLSSLLVAADHRCATASPASRR